MPNYNSLLKEEALKLSDEIGLKQTAQQLGIHYHTLASWRHKKKINSEKRNEGSQNKRVDSQSKKEQALLLENAKLLRANVILKEALYLLAKDRK